MITIICGIIFGSNKNNTSVNRTIIKLYFNQKDRGKNGFGFINTRTGVYHRARFEHEIFSLMKKNKGTEILFHHRSPTSTPNTEQTAHPICSNDNFNNKYYLVHNGIIYNGHELFEEHKKLGLKYSTLLGKNDDLRVFNDSECLLIELGLYLEGKKDKVNTEGSVAFILLETDKNNKPINLHFGRNYSNPLKIIQTDKEIIISSDGEGEFVEVNKLHTFSYETGKMTSKPLTLERNIVTYYNNINRVTNWDHEYVGLSPVSRISSLRNNDCPPEEKYINELTDEEIQEYKGESLNCIQVAQTELLGSINCQERERLRLEKEGAEKTLRLLDKEISKRSKIIIA